MTPAEEDGTALPPLKRALIDPPSLLMSPFGARALDTWLALRKASLETFVTVLAARFLLASVCAPNLLVDRFFFFLGGDKGGAGDGWRERDGGRQAESGWFIWKIFYYSP